MLEIFCRCSKCGASLIADTDATILAYYRDYTARAILYNSQEPPEVPEYTVMRCSDLSCNFSEKYTHEELLKMRAEYWSKIAWSFAVSDHVNAFQFEDKFTRFLSFKGYDKFKTPSEIKHDQVLKEFYEYCETESTDQSDD